MHRCKVGEKRLWIRAIEVFLQGLQIASQPRCWCRTGILRGRKLRASELSLFRKTKFWWGESGARCD